nr:formin-like protein 18 [Setaria viridis]
MQLKFPPFLPRTGAAPLPRGLRCRCTSPRCFHRRAAASPFPSRRLLTLPLHHGAAQHGARLLPSSPPPRGQAASSPSVAASPLGRLLLPAGPRQPPPRASPPPRRLATGPPPRHRAAAYLPSDSRVPSPPATAARPGSTSSGAAACADPDGAGDLKEMAAMDAVGWDRMHSGSPAAVAAPLPRAAAASSETMATRSAPYLN